MISESRSLCFLLLIMEELKKRIAELEEELKVERSKNATLQQNVRQKISEMSSEVVDSNPYRYSTRSVASPVKCKSKFLS